MEILAQGAEATIVKIDENVLQKIRTAKPYRLEQIDNKIRRFRNKREFKVLTKLYEANLNVPKPIKDITNLKEKIIAFTFEYIDGKVLKDVMNEVLLFKAFDEIIEMHQFGVVHGDLTTLNMIVKDKGGNCKIYLIDFGLSEFTKKQEQRAVDLNLFFTCIKNEHPDYHKYKQDLIEKYEEMIDESVKIIDRLEKMEYRGRNK